MKKTAILLVDVQNDFCTGGALAVRDGDAVVPVCNELIGLAAAQGAGRPVAGALRGGKSGRSVPS